jgi:hypothetical protein
VRALRTCSVALALVAGALTARSEPDLRAARVIGPLTVCLDDARRGVAYFFPGDIILAVGDQGRPDLHLLQMRYIGTSVAGDRGAIIHRSVLSFRVRLAQPTAESLQAARKALGVTDLRALPITRMETGLVYAPIGGADQTEKATALPSGHFEADSDAGLSNSTSYWRERIYTLSPDDVASQIFWDTLQKGQLVMSLGYAFFASGVGSEKPLTELTGSPELVAEMRRQLDTGAAGDSSKAADHLVRAGALPIEIDAQKWPDLLSKVDLNDSLPPEYAVLEVRCYDFNNALRPDLAAKQVEIEAEAIGGESTQISAIFDAGQPDLCVRNLRFQVAVRLDRPYRFRVTDVKWDGTTDVGPWTQRESWSQLLDVTSPAAPATGDAAEGAAKGATQ